MYMCVYCFCSRVVQHLRMPAKQGLCWCLGGRGGAPPEISYGLENGGMTLQPIPLDLPMPTDEDQLNATFAELVVSTICGCFLQCV